MGCAKKMSQRKVVMRGLEIPKQIPLPLMGGARGGCICLVTPHPRNHLWPLLLGEREVLRVIQNDFDTAAVAAVEHVEGFVDLTE